MMESSEGSRVPHVAIVEPDDLQQRLLERMLRGVTSFTYKMYESVKAAGEAIDEIGVADLVVLPIHAGSGFLAVLEGRDGEPPGVQLAKFLRAHYPSVPIMFYTGGAPVPQMCVTERPITFYQLRVLTTRELEVAVLQAIHIAKRSVKTE